MNNNEFKNEIQKCLQIDYNQFEEYQVISVEILKEFNRVCNKNGINYWLSYGTLLGAVRDGCQAPWDYDIDVVVFFNDKDTLLGALKSDLSSDYYYSYIDNTNHYPGGNRMLRVCKNGFSMMAIHVDVFFLVGAVPDKAKTLKYYKRLLRYVFIFDIKCLPYHYEEPIKDNTQKLVKKIFKILYGFIPFFLLKKMELKYLNKYSSEKYVFLSGAYIPVEMFETDYISLYNTRFPIPRGYDYILTQLYGDYNQYPSFDSRFMEFYNHKKLIDRIQSDYINKNGTRIQRT